MIFTSGSTGQPKGAVIGHRRLADKLAVLDRLLRFKPDDVVLVPLQLTFIFGLWVVLLALQAGSKPLLVPRFTADALRRGLDAGATILGGVPSMYRTALAEPTFSALNLRMILTGGEVLPKPLAVAIQAMSPRAKIFDLYGLTETGSCDFVLKPSDQPDGLGTIGVPTDQVALSHRRRRRTADPDAVRHAGLSRQSRPHRKFVSGRLFQDRRSRARSPGWPC